MNTPTRPRTAAKAPATFARMLVLAQRRFDAQRLPPAGIAASASTSAAALRHWAASNAGLAGNRAA